ncbi:MAG TPA: gamma-glutamyl-gamma-aminobutyrate hydrolase family protein, partial [Bacteroidia bacterium]|nr:gamma-glutamyl-gamma-aminobutyrate hydrolase family protein [Bacteroidia bacterium]
SESGIMPQLIKKYHADIPILGVCLGHQAIAESFGASLSNLDKVHHGIQRELIITKPEDRLFAGLPEKITTGHYHSWVVEKKSLPPDFEITAIDGDDTIMAMSHNFFPLSGIQFHPESIMTENGLKIMENWLKFCGHIR